MKEPKGIPESKLADLNRKSWDLRYVDQTLSREAAREAGELAREADDLQGLAYANLNLAVGHFLRSENREALELLTLALNYFGVHREEMGYAASLNYTGNIYESFGDYEQALDFCQRAYEAASAWEHREMLGEVHGVLGLIYSRLSDHERSLKAYQESLRIRQDMGDSMAAASSLNRIARTYSLMKRYDEAIVYYERSLDIRLQLKQKGVIAWTYLGMASTYEAMARLSDAEAYYRMMLEGKQQCLDDRCRLQALLGLGRVLQSGEQPEGALSCFMEAHSLAEKLDARPLLVETHYALSGHYEAAQHFERALHHYKCYREIRDGVMNDETRNRLKNQQIAFAIEKSEKEKEIFQLRNVELKAAYDEIHHKNREITDSINYASRIQGALLPHGEKLSSVFPEHFIFYLPKDMVSGDFYWASEVGGKLIFAAADCTGHGVPGALMSMLGISFLNEIVSKGQETDPGKILDALRVEVIKALKQSGSEGEQQDGMDMALCSYDPRQQLLHFAGAFNPLYLVRDGILQEFRPDRMPVSYYYRDSRPFNSTSLSLREGDIIYIFSDGFADQFGGPKRKKFKSRKMKELLELIHEKDMDQQKLMLYERFFYWKRDLEQVDDVVILGLKIPAARS